jgi:diguanylate cyclase (GGDEF)-like protein/PAS domain S-box-containing protein
MLEKFRRLLEAPNFPGDENKNAQAKIMNSVGNYLLLALFIASVLYVPFFAKHKLLSWLVVLLMLLLYAVTRYYMHRGKLDLGGRFMVIAGWIICQVMILTGGGMESPMVFALMAVTTAVGLLFHLRIGRIILIASSLACLVFAILQQNGIRLPQVFVYSPVGVWFYFTLSLVFISWTMNLTVRKLSSALVLAQEQNEARNHAEVVLRLSEEKYRLLFDNAGDAILIHDDTGRILAANLQAVMRLGYSHDELCLLTIQDVEAPDQSMHISGRNDKLVRVGNVTFETVHRARGGALIPVEASSRRVTWDGKPVFMSICRDITERKQTEKALRTSQEEMQAILNAIPDLMFEVDMDGRIFDFHAPLHESLYLAPELFTDKKVEEVLPAQASNVIMAALVEADQQGWHSGASYALNYPEGERWFELSIQAKNVAAGMGKRYITLVREITGRKQAEKEELEQRTLAEGLRDTVIAMNSTLDFHEVLDRILDNVGRVVPHDASNIMLIDEDGNSLVIACSRGYVERGAMGINDNALRLAEMPTLLRAVDIRAPLIIPDAHADPEWQDFPSTRWVRSFLSAPVRVRQQIVGFLNLDSTVPGFFNKTHADRLSAFAEQAAIAIENARLYEEVKKMAIMDALTGIYNRTFFEAELERIGRARLYPVSVVVADLDNMKQVNDRFGHPAGDELLKRTATVLQAVFRSADILARIGGDEFAVLLPETDAVTAAHLLERIHAKLQEHNTHYASLPLQLSLGVATAEHENLMQAFIDADQRMYANKTQRKSTTSL